MFVLPSYGQTYSHIISNVTENTEDSIVFQHCIDSIAKYVYLDSRKIKPYMDLAEDLISNESKLSNRQLLDFEFQRIYNEYNYNNTLGVYKIIERNRDKLNLNGITQKQKNHFNYLDAYTLLTLGEVDSAQEKFYELLDFASQNKDTSLMLQNLSSLGRLLGLQGDTENAEQFFFKFNALIPKHKTTHRAAFYSELIQLYIGSRQYDKAEQYNELALEFADSLNLVDLQVDFLLQKVSISLEKGNPTLAIDAYKEARKIAETIDNQNYLERCMIAYARILDYKNQYGESLAVYEQFINKARSEKIPQSELLDYLKSASKIAHKKGDFKKAFQYTTKANEISDSLFIEEQKEKSQYLQIKFDADKKQKDNELLSSEILRQKTQNRLLYSLAALFLVSSLFLFFAFYQKKNYNSLLESEVKDRTGELEVANQSLQILNTELRDLSYALSHDLKEPIITLVQFCQLAREEVESSSLSSQETLVKYLDFIDSNGGRLKLLIEGISDFQSINFHVKEQYELVDLEAVMQSIIDSIILYIEERNAVVSFKDLPKIHSNESLLFFLFKNLIENGIKYNKSDVPTIDIDYEKIDNFHVFNVRDNGIGIDPVFHDRVFGLFNRLNIRDEYKGSGLGLNIAKKTAEKLDGSIHIAKSEPDKGSCFQVRLPIIKAT